MAHDNFSDRASARVLDIDVFFYLEKGINHYAKACRDNFFYPDKVISDVNRDLNDAKLTLEVELRKAQEERQKAYLALEEAKAQCEYYDWNDDYDDDFSDDWDDDDSSDDIIDYSAEEDAYNAALYAEELVEKKLSELQELRKYYNEVEAEYKENKNSFKDYLDKNLENASQWMKEEYQLMKDYIWQGQQLK